MRPHERYRFGEFEIDFAKECLLRGDAEVALAPQPFALLRLLIERRDELVSRREAAEHLWGERHVETEQGLNYCVRQIRKALGESADSPDYIQTVPRRGYRFRAPVEAVPGPARHLAPRAAWLGLATLTLLAAVAGAWWIWSTPASAEAQIVIESVQVTGIPTGRFVGEALLERLQDQLAELPGVTVVERPSTANPDHVFTVRAAVSDHPNGVQIDLRLLQGAGHDVVWSAVATAAPEDLGPLDQDLRHDLVTTLRSVLDGTAVEGEQTIERSRSLPDEPAR